MDRAMGRVHVGAGGWGYFAGGLPAYARAFSFVEVNATFYRRVPETMAGRWRSRAPPAFVFAVKANRDVTHRARLRPTPAARAAFAHDLRIARILDARYLILETPGSLPFGAEEIAGLRDLAAMADGRPRIGLEARAHAGTALPPGLRRAMEEAGVVDVVDLSRGRPRVAGDVVYTRLFGKGAANVYEFDDDELRALDRAGRDAVEVAFAFHGVRMYKDAARFLTFKRTGRFPNATGAVGVESLAAVLGEDARFPTTREALIADQGWKLVDLDASTRAHARDVLERLPDRPFRDLRDVLDAATSVLGDPGSGRSQP
jgi:uncharacterized protein YecE (DUF72 family)